MIVALVVGSDDAPQFPGRNTFPLLGRPLMVYPLLAARYSELVDRTFLTTGSEAIARVGRHHNVTVIDRPPELSAPSVTLEQLLGASFAAIVKETGDEPEAVVLLLCNAPTVTSGMIDKAIQMLSADREADAVISVAQHNEFSPLVAQQLAEDGTLQPLTSLPSGHPGADAYFPDALLWVLRPRAIRGAAASSIMPNWIVNTGRQRVLPLIHEGYGDVDHRWQIPLVEEWLRRHGFSDETTPYDTTEAIVATLPLARPRDAAVGRAPANRRVLVTTIPFGDPDRRSLDILDRAGVDYTINPIGRKIKETELAELIGDFGVLIAGTERISANVLARAPHLRLISRVGIGLDGVDLVAARARGIEVSYTPDAPTPAVGELTIGLMLSLLRFIPHADRGMRNGVWHRYMGRRIAELTVGLIGVGRVGKRVIKHLKAFNTRILANDLNPDHAIGEVDNVHWVDKERIYAEADVISLHVPLTLQTRNLVTSRELNTMKHGAIVINTARGTIVNEHDLAEALRSGHLGGAAVDVFGQEPYAGELALLDNCLLTAHMGSMSSDCRVRMEIEATEEAVRFLSGEPLRQLVPEDEYAVQRQVAAAVA